MSRKISTLVSGVFLILTAMAANHEATAQVVGKPVRIVSVPYYYKGVDLTCAAIETAAAQGADMIVLTETWLGQYVWKTVNDPDVVRIAGLAKKYHTYIISPISRVDGTKHYNSSLLYDRNGNLVCIYNKVYPVMPSSGVYDGIPGEDALVFDTDFGRIGIAICFDGLFPEVWQRLEDKGAEIVFVSSAMSGGTFLGAYATLHHYYVVSSVWSSECQVFDITGDKLLDVPKSSSNVTSRITLNFGRRMFYDDVVADAEYGAKYAKMMQENPGIVVDKLCPREGWRVLRPTVAGVDISAIAKTYGVPEIRAFFTEQRGRADAIRGYVFKPTMNRNITAPPRR